SHYARPAGRPSASRMPARSARRCFLTRRSSTTPGPHAAGPCAGDMRRAPHLPPGRSYSGELPSYRAARSEPRPTQLPANRTVLLVQRGTIFVRLLSDRTSQIVAVLLEFTELLDEPFSIQLIDVLTIFGQSHLSHERHTFLMKGDRDDRPLEHQRQQHIMKSRRHNRISRRDL